MTVNTYDVTLTLLRFAQESIVVSEAEKYRMTTSKWVIAGNGYIIDLRDQYLQSHWAKTNGEPDFLVVLNPSDLDEFKHYINDDAQILAAIALVHMQSTRDLNDAHDR